MPTLYVYADEYTNQYHRQRLDIHTNGQQRIYHHSAVLQVNHVDHHILTSRPNARQFCSTILLDNINMDQGTRNIYYTDELFNMSVVASIAAVERAVVMS